MATLQLPVYGYGIRYEYGIFFQKIVDGQQVEAPDNWLRYENPWEIARPEYLYPGALLRARARARRQRRPAAARLGGHAARDGDGVRHADSRLRQPHRQHAAAVDGEVVARLRPELFNAGEYVRAVEDKRQSEIISKVLYPNDQFFAGVELRLKQEYFLVSATLQDALRRYKKRHAQLRVESAGQGRDSAQRHASGASRSPS